VLRFVAARVRQTAIVAFVVTSLSFVLIHAAPGDPLATLDVTPETLGARNQLRIDFGLDRPLYEQYPVMLGSFARGRFGTSFSQSRPVSDVLRDVIPDTLLLMVPALAIGILLGVAAGTWQGWAAGRFRDRAASAMELIILSVPEFLIALVASGVFAVRYGWFPATDIMRAGAVYASWADRVGDYAHHAVLPVGTLALVIACVVARFQRSAVISTLGEEFVRTARSTGASTMRILFRHVLRRTSASICALLGLLFPSLVGGAAIVEVVFGWPGAGNTLVTAVGSRDYPLVIALVTVGSVAVCVGSALADAAATIADPATPLDA